MLVEPVANPEMSALRLPGLLPRRLTWPMNANVFKKTGWPRISKGFCSSVYTGDSVLGNIWSRVCCCRAPGVASTVSTRSGGKDGSLLSALRWSSERKCGIHLTSTSWLSNAEDDSTFLPLKIAAVYSAANPELASYCVLRGGYGGSPAIAEARVLGRGESLTQIYQGHVFLSGVPHPGHGVLHQEI